MITKDDSRQRWASTARTALAGAVLGGIGGAITGVLILLADSSWTHDQALAIGLFYGAPFGVVVGAALGVISGAVGGCLAMHVVRRHAVGARVVLAVCCAVFTAVVMAWALSGTPQVVGVILAAVLAGAAAWMAAPWCFRPLRGTGSPTT